MATLLLKFVVFLFSIGITALLLYRLTSSIINVYLGYSVQGCQDGDVRFDPDRDNVVQVCLGDQWGYVCARDYSLDRWTTTDNNVFCQQMGLLGSSTFQLYQELYLIHIYFYTADNSSSSFQANSSIDGGMISFQTVFCIGTEKRLIDCPHDDFDGNTRSNACSRNNSHHYARATCSKS